MKLTICLLLCCLANVCFSFPMRDGSKDPPETPNDEDPVPTEIIFKELTTPTKAVIQDDYSHQRLLRRRQRDTEISAPTPSEELASTTPLVIKGSIDDDAPVPTPSEELASTTPLVIQDGDPDQWERRVRRSEDDVRAPPTVALQVDFNGTVEEVTETTSATHIPGPQHRLATHFMSDANVDHIGSANQKLKVDEETESAGKPRRRRAVQNDVIPDLGMPILKNREQQNDTTPEPTSEDEQVENLGMPFPKEYVTHEMPKTEDESGWTHSRRFVRNKRSQDGQTAAERPEKVEIPEAPSTAPLIKDRIQIESETLETTKEVPKPTEAAGAASEDKQDHVEGPKKTSISPLVMDRIADELDELTTESPKPTDQVRLRRSNRKQWKEEPMPEDGGQTTEAPMNEEEAEEPFSTEERRKRSEEDKDVRIEEIERVLAGENIDSIENDTKSKRRARSTPYNGEPRERTHHKKPGVEAVEKAGLAATLEQQRAHVQGEDGGKMQAAGAKKQMENDSKNERRHRRSAQNNDAGTTEATEADKIADETAASETTTVRIMLAGSHTEAGAEEKSGEGELQDGRGEAGPAGGMSAGHIEPEVEQQKGSGEAGPSGGMSASDIKPEEETRSSVLRKRSATVGAEDDENAFHSTPDTSEKGFYEIDCRGRVFC